MKQKSSGNSERVPTPARPILISIIDVQDKRFPMKVRKTQEGGWIVLAFSSFSPTEVTDQKQIEFSFWCDNQNLNAADKNTERERERERRKTQSNYTSSIHKPEVVLSLLHFQWEFTKM